jgi:hypothetical protein
MIPKLILRPLCATHRLTNPAQRAEAKVDANSAYRRHSLLLRHPRPYPIAVS